MQKCLILNFKLIIATGTATKEVNAEIETQPLTAEQKKENVQRNLKPYTLFYIFHSLYHCVLFPLKVSFLLCLSF